MKRKAALGLSTGGFTFLEVMLVVAILCIVTSMFFASWATVQARIRWSSTKANMDSIAKAGFTDYTYNAGNNDGTTDWAPSAFGHTPARLDSEGLLTRWPDGPCPGWFYSWEDWSPANLPIVRVTLRRPNLWPYISFCVNTYGGGDCQGIDPMSPGIPIELSSNETIDNHIYCTE